MTPFAHEWLLDHARRRPDAPAVGTPAGWTTYAELGTRLHHLAALLAGRGVRRGDFVVSTLPSGPLAVAGALAVQALAACAVEIDRATGVDAARAILRQTRARVALVAGRDAAAWGRHAREHALHLVVVHPVEPPAPLRATLEGSSWEWLPELGPFEGASLPAVDRAASDAALLVYTSGSTGTPRGVVQSHENVDANTRAIVEYLELGPADRVLSILPLFYCYGKSLLQTHLHVGGSVFFDDRFMYPRRVMEAIGEERITGFSGVPLTFELLRRKVDLHTLDLSSLRYVTQAGGAMAPDTIRWAREAFAPARLFVMYGQTEATARLSYLPPERAREKEGSVGRGLPNVELRVVDEQGRELPPGETGELVARGPSITRGYLDAPAETAAILHDGWLWTGDLGHRDEDGFVFITGRAREVLKLGGHRVSPVEIEQVLARHPAVAEAAVVGAHDPTSGEAAVGFVVPAPGADPTEEDLRRHCREALPVYKVPREVRIVASLPRTASGKIARAELKERVTR